MVLKNWENAGTEKIGLNQDVFSSIFLSILTILYHICGPDDVIQNDEIWRNLRHLSVKKYVALLPDNHGR